MRCDSVMWWSHAWCTPPPCSLNEMLGEASDGDSDLDLGDEMDEATFEAMMEEARAAKAKAKAKAGAADGLERMRDGAGMGGMPDLDMDAEMAKMMREMNFEDMEQLLKENGVDLEDEAVSVEELLGKGPRLSGTEMQELADLLKDLTPERLESDPAYVLW